MTTAEDYSLKELLLEHVVYLFVTLNALLDPVPLDNGLAFPNIDDCSECCACMVYKWFLLLHLEAVLMSGRCT